MIHLFLKQIPLCLSLGGRGLASLVVLCVVEGGRHFGVPSKAVGNVVRRQHVFWQETGAGPIYDRGDPPCRKESTPDPPGSDCTPYPFPRLWDWWKWSPLLKSKGHAVGPRKGRSRRANLGINQEPGQGTWHLKNKTHVGREDGDVRKMLARPADTDLGESRTDSWDP